MQSYLDQLTEKAKKKRVNLADAAVDCGVNRSTVWRWFTGKADVSYRTAQKIWLQLDRMPRGKSA